MAIQKATVEDIIKTINADKSTPRFAVLLGAGASVSAGVPHAEKMVAELKQKIYARETGNNKASQEEIEAWVKEQDWYKSIPQEELEDKEYNEVFEQYSNNRPDRQAYVAECVARATSLNWTHIYLANLVKSGCIHTILTTNFDGLAFKALFQQGEEVVTCHHPDHARGISFSGNYPLIVHLHGHYLHYDIKNTEKEVGDLSPEFKELFKNVVRENGLIIIGYKGRKEYVTELLLDFKSKNLFKYNLYWVARGTAGTLSKLARELLEYEHSYVIENSDADNFFLQLNHDLDLGFPPFIEDPVSNLIETMEPLRDLKLLKSGKFSEVSHSWFITKIERLKDFHKTEKKKEESEESRELYDKFLLLYEEGKTEKAEEQLKAAIEKSQRDANLYFAYGTLLLERGDDDNIKKSFAKYKLAIKHRPDYPEVYNNWGSALSDLGKIIGGDAGQALIRESFEKYELAIKYRPDDHQVYYNWGNALYNLGKIIGGDAGQALIRESFEKYELAIKYRPDDNEAYNNWGNALSDLAKMIGGDAGQALIRESFEKYELAIKYRLDYHDAYNNWGNALSDLGKIIGGDAGQALIRESFEKYELAIKYKPDYHEAYYNWAVSTQELADLLPAEEEAEKEKLIEQAKKLFEKAESLK